MEQFIFLVDFLFEKIRILHSYLSWGNGLRKQVSSEMLWLVFFDDYGHQSCLGAGCMLLDKPCCDLRRISQCSDRIHILRSSPLSFLLFYQGFFF